MHAGAGLCQRGPGHSGICLPLQEPCHSAGRGGVFHDCLWGFCIWLDQVKRPQAVRTANHDNACAAMAECIVLDSSNLTFWQKYTRNESRLTKAAREGERWVMKGFKLAGNHTCNRILHPDVPGLR